MLILIKLTMFLKKLINKKLIKKLATSIVFFQIYFKNCEEKLSSSGPGWVQVRYRSGPG